MLNKQTIGKMEIDLPCDRAATIRTIPEWFPGLTLVIAIPADEHQRKQTLWNYFGPHVGRHSVLYETGKNYQLVAVEQQPVSVARLSAALVCWRFARLKLAGWGGSCQPTGSNPEYKKTHTS